MEKVVIHYKGPKAEFLGYYKAGYCNTTYDRKEAKVFIFYTEEQKERQIELLQRNLNNILRTTKFSTGPWEKHFNMLKNLFFKKYKRGDIEICAMVVDSVNEEINSYNEKQFK